jgi:hypothetical protein
MDEVDSGMDKEGGKDNSKVNNMDSNSDLILTVVIALL